VIVVALFRGIAAFITAATPDYEFLYLQLLLLTDIGSLKLQQLVSLLLILQLALQQRYVLLLVLPQALLLGLNLLLKPDHHLLISLEEVHHLLIAEGPKLAMSPAQQIQLSLI
jgi:hypothetical protein